MSTPLPPDERVGTTVGDYRVESVLGIGGMGRVYLATDPAGNRVALKIVKADLASDETFRKRFVREAHVAQTVDHPAVVPVLATGEHDGLPWIAQRLVDGGTLDERIKTEGSVDLATAVSCCERVAGGLEAVWAAGIFHRDVKPGNVLFDLEGKAYITDFGLAKDTQGSVLTMPGQALGSMDYMAPEQIRGEEITAAADIYALGCTMYEAVCGRPPFADRQGMRVLWAHLQDQPADARTLRSDLPPAFSAALMLALRKDPAERPSTASEYARALREGAQV